MEWTWVQLMHTGRRATRDKTVPQNKWMQLTRSAHGQAGRGPRS